MVFNGKENILNGSISVQSFLRKESINPKTVVVIYNSQQLVREELGSTFIKEDDNIEVIKFIIGG